MRSARAILSLKTSEPDMQALLHGLYIFLFVEPIVKISVGEESESDISESDAQALLHSLCIFLFVEPVVIGRFVGASGFAFFKTFEHIEA